MNRLWQGLRRRIGAEQQMIAVANVAETLPTRDPYLVGAVALPGASPVEAATHALRASRYPCRIFVSADSAWLLGLAIGSPKGTVIITPVQAADIPALDIPWNSLYTPSILRQQMDDGQATALRVWASAETPENTPPGVTVVNAPQGVPNGPQWVHGQFAAGQTGAGANEYIISDGWRRRRDVAQIVETRARLHRHTMIEAMAAVAAWRGCGAIVAGNEELAAQQRFYYGIGFTDLEQVIYYEKPDMLLSAPPRMRLQPPAAPADTPNTLTIQTRRLDPAHLDERDVTGVSTLDRLLGVDNAAFPWLWWNSATELRAYTNTPDVTLYQAFISPPDGADTGGWDWADPVGYFSYTHYDRWAHLDRLAVNPVWQGRNIGAYLLDYSIRLQAAGGARRVSLSTQSTNHRSQRLYEGFGFRRVRSLEYTIVGRWLRPERAANHRS